MAIKKTKYCAHKPCHKPIKSGIYCSLECGVAHSRVKALKKPQSPYIKAVNKILLSKPIKRIAIRKVSKKRAKANTKYMLQRASFLQNKICPITGRPATEIHHKKGRDNAMLNDMEYWLAVTREGHIWIHANPKEAEEKGYIVKRSTKNK